MTQPLTPPTFGQTFNVSPTDIGSGYAAGITSAGKSIASAISSVMGGYNERTGEVEPGILDQKKSSEDMLDMLFQHGMMDQDMYEKAKTSGLTAQQKIIGQSTAEYNTRLQVQLEKEKALAVQQAQEAGALTRQGMAGRTTIEAAHIAAQARDQAAAAKAPSYVRRAPTTGPTEQQSGTLRLPNLTPTNPDINRPVPNYSLMPRT